MIRCRKNLGFCCYAIKIMLFFFKLRIIPEELKILSFFLNDRQQVNQGVLGNIAGEVDEEQVFPILF